MPFDLGRVSPGRDAQVAVAPKVTDPHVGTQPKRVKFERHRLRTCSKVRVRIAVN